MHRIILIIAIMMSMAFIPQQKTKVVLFGDSITEQGVKPGGYVTLLDSLSKATAGDPFEFIGAGIGGNKVYDLYLRMEADVLDKNPGIVVIYIGVNDVWHKRSSGTGTDADKFEKFYDAILKKLKQKNIKAVICTPAVIGEKTDYTNPLDGDLNLYSGIIRNIAHKNNLPLVDLRQIFLDYNKKYNTANKEKGSLTVDGVHLNAKGNQLVADAIWKAVK
jgi:isoamyl acetate esterase